MATTDRLYGNRKKVIKDKNTTSANFGISEINILVDITYSFKNIIEHKKNDEVSFSEKNRI